MHKTAIILLSITLFIVIIKFFTSDNGRENSKSMAIEQQVLINDKKAEKITESKNSPSSLKQKNTANINKENNLEKSKYKTFGNHLVNNLAKSGRQITSNIKNDYISQPRNISWADKTEQKIYNYYNNSNLISVANLTSLECKTTVCKAVFHPYESNPSKPNQSLIQLAKMTIDSHENQYFKMNRILSKHKDSNIIISKNALVVTLKQEVKALT